jgi:hypothetical protein
MPDETLGHDFRRKTTASQAMLRGSFVLLYNYTMSAGTFNLLLIIIALGWLAWRGAIAAQVAIDARRRGFTSGEIVRWALIAVIDTDRYWWGARLDRLSVAEARELLVEMTKAHHLLSVTNVRCPLCDDEIKNVLSVADDSDLYVRRQSACAHCDFRVDACRHCAHFLPAVDGATVFDQSGDFSHGRCGFYRSVEAVRTAYPQHATHMEALGYDVLPVPKLIADSFIPLAECTAFSLKPELLRQSKVPWINRQRAALIRLQQRLNRVRS